MDITKTFQGIIKKTGINSLGVTLPPAIRDKVEHGKDYEFSIKLKEEQKEAN